MCSLPVMPYSNMNNLLQFPIYVYDLSLRLAVMVPLPDNKSLLVLCLKVLYYSVPLLISWWVLYSSWPKLVDQLLQYPIFPYFDSWKLLQYKFGPDSEPHFKELNKSGMNKGDREIFNSLQLFDFGSKILFLLEIIWVLSNKLCIILGNYCAFPSNR